MLCGDIDLAERMLDSTHMSAPRLRLRLILPIGLILLVVVLGALQYRWLGQVSEAERAQLQRSLNQRAREFADEFDKEIGLAYALLGATPESVEKDLWPTLDRKVNSWKSQAPHADLVKAVYFTRPGLESGSRTLEQLAIGTGTGRMIEWPERLAPVLRVLDRIPPRPLEVPQAAQVLTLSRNSVVESVPALIIPVLLPPPHIVGDGKVDMMVALRMPAHSAVVVELDREVLKSRVLPELVERVFPEGEAGQYHIAIRNNSPEPLYSRGIKDAAEVTPANADAVATFFSAAHREVVTRMVTEGQLLSWEINATGLPRVAAGATVATRTPKPSQSNISVMLQERTRTNEAGTMFVTGLGGWTIALRHGAGSLDAAVAQARRRNLGISFSILSVLAVGVGIIVANARRSEKLAAQQMEFVATVSHELRTPLAVIRSAAQNLSAGVVDDPIRAKRYGELIEAEGRRLTDMVEEVLEFAGLSGQRRALALKAVDVVSLVRDVVGASSALLDAAQVQAEVAIGDDVPLVNGDEEALRRAFSNLLANALKHGRDGRWVGLSVTRQRENGHDDVLIAVSDRGRGIDTEDCGKVFEPFYRGRHAVDQQIQGNGLGLSLVQRIAEAHGGRVTVASVPGQGAAFTVRLPVTADLAGA
jgi:signal transduction histidine kinase/type II secretory pathway pseudopilin PulG